MDDDGLPPYIGFAGLWRLELSGLEIARLGPMLEARLARDPGNADAMMDIATLSILTLNPENRAAAFAMQARALEIKQVFRIPAARQPPALRVLAIASPGDMTAITHLDCLLEGSDVELLVLYARPGADFPSALPGHDVVFVAAGESPDNRPVLEQIARFVRTSAKPVLNSPERILLLSRDSVARMLRSVPGVAMPLTAGVARRELERVARGELPLGSVLEDGAFPVIVRPLDSQGGKDLDRLEGPAELVAYLARVEGDAFFVSRFVDYSGPDGFYRKYRVVLVGGRPYACHMAISERWMIHYVNADMDASAWKRAEEAGFMEGFDSGFARKHARALSAIDSLLGLDYYAIDCAEARSGELLVFEADTAMLVHAMDPADLYPYKQAPMRRIFEAFRALLGSAAKKKTR
ncbi:MAG: RimK family alpha-L-glutamate ligase [Proteobacteria bacterium]|nr:RimK family alpha-L-glutamate ligase [Pseudomonadota bacterium]